MKEVVAEIELIGQQSGGEPFPIVVRIGKPYHRDGGKEEWGCPVSIMPLYESLHDAVGGDPFQALCLGNGLILYLLQDFREKGGTLRYKGGNDEVPLDAYAFDAVFDRRESS